MNYLELAEKTLQASKGTRVVGEAIQEHLPGNTERTALENLAAVYTLMDIAQSLRTIADYTELNT